IGAIPILMTPFTGPTNQTSWMDRGRTYYAQVDFYDRTGTVTPTAILSVACPIPAGQTRSMLSLGMRSTAFRIVSSYLSHTVQVQEGTAQPVSGSSLYTIDDEWVTTPATITPSGDRFIQLTRTAGGVDEFVSGYIE